MTESSAAFTLEDCSPWEGLEPGQGHGLVVDETAAAKVPYPPTPEGQCAFLRDLWAVIRSGTYDFRIWIMGGDCGEAEVYAYAKLDGEIVAKAPMEITVWNEWHAGEITGIEYAEGRTLTVGVYVKASNPGAWGKIDDAILYRQ